MSSDKLNCKNCKNHEDCYIISEALDWAYHGDPEQCGRDFGVEWEPLDGDKRFEEWLERQANNCDEYVGELISGDI